MRYSKFLFPIKFGRRPQRPRSSQDNPVFNLGHVPFDPTNQYQVQNGYTPRHLSSPPSQQQFNRPRNWSPRFHHHHNSGNAAPIDPTYQYKDVRGRVSSRHFVPKQPHPVQPYHRKKAASNTRYESCTLRQCVCILSIIGVLIVGGGVTGLILYRKGNEIFKILYYIEILII